jgi:hypothetical protein
LRNFRRNLEANLRQSAAGIHATASSLPQSPTAGADGFGG